MESFTIEYTGRDRSRIMQIVRDICGLRIIDMIGMMELSPRCSRGTLINVYTFRY